MARIHIGAAFPDVDWHDLTDLETVASWPAAVRGLVLLCVLLLGVVPASRFVSSHLSEELKMLAEEAATLERELEQQLLTAAALPAQRATTLASEESLAALHRQLPVEEQVPELLDSVTAVGHDNRLEFVSVSLEQKQQQAFYSEQPIRMQVRGSYHGFANFISGVTALPRLVTLHDFSLERVADGLLSIDFTLRVYQRDLPSPGVAFGAPEGSATEPEIGAAYKIVSYAGASLRSPFDGIGIAQTAESPLPAVAPIERPTGALERFPLTGLSMVGTIAHGAVTQALVRDSSGTVHRVGTGSYMGQDHGRIQRITAERIELMEIVQAGDGWVQRPRDLLLQSACSAPCEMAAE